jgi:putative spermidine/putrescine transport system permease protein
MDECAIEPADHPLPASARGGRCAGCPTCSAHPRRCCSAAAGAAAAVARRRLSRLAVRAAGQSFFSIDEFSAWSCASSRSRPTPSCCSRPTSTSSSALTDGGAVTLAAGSSPFRSPTTRRATPRRAWKALFYLGVMLPLWSSYLVQGLRLEADPRQGGRLNWLFDKLRPDLAARRAARLPVIGGRRCRSLHRHVHRLRLHVAAVHDPADPGGARARAAVLIEASADLGARPGQTFRNVILPLALPGVVAGSIFTFSLTLGDYIIPQVIGTSRSSSARRSTVQQGTAGNIPLAAAFSWCRSSSWASTCGSPSAWGPSMRSEPAPRPRR